jgi:16S rRNA A1518/A1519 N6-dimethyltransferase RsmA/KsgA/DIM1 with predicted DNA glycosylase/AP lyase activity
MSNGWNHNIQYHEVVLQSAPSPCLRALDVGCGQGLLTRRIGHLCDNVVGIDLDCKPLPGRPGNLPPRAGVSFVAGDVMTYPSPPASFDFIAGNLWFSIAPPSCAIVDEETV